MPIDSLTGVLACPAVCRLVIWADGDQRFNLPSIYLL